MPYGQAVVRNVTAQAAGNSRSQQRCDSVGRQGTHQQAKQHEDLNGNLHVPRRLMRRIFGQVDRFAVEKHVMHEAQRVSD